MRTCGMREFEGFAFPIPHPRSSNSHVPHSCIALTVNFAKL
jgi:hypothetical protein